MIIIYSLSDPRQPEQVRYVGKTGVDIRYRIKQHMWDAKKHSATHRRHWIKSLLDAGVLPSMQVIEIVEDDGWQAREQYWIASFRALGHQLTNSTDGGEGTVGYRQPMSDETKRKIGNANKGKIRSTEVLELWRRQRIGRSISLDQRAKISAALKGRKQSDEHKAKVLAKVTGRTYGPPSEEQREKLRKASAAWWARDRAAILEGRRKARLDE